VNPLASVGLVLAALFLLLALGWRLNTLWYRAYRAKRTLVLGIDKQRGDLELRYVKPKNNQLVWGTVKEAGVEHDGVIIPGGPGAAFTLNGSGRAVIINRRTLTTLRVSNDRDELEGAPEDGWQVGMYAVGVHERNIARPSGGTWLDTLASYTPILVIVLGIVMVLGFAFIAAKFH